MNPSSQASTSVLVSSAPTGPAGTGAAAGVTAAGTMSCASTPPAPASSSSGTSHFLNCFTNLPSKPIAPRGAGRYLGHESPMQDLDILIGKMSIGSGKALLNDNPPNLGTIMRALRDRYGWTLKEMSKHSGIPFSTLSKVENGRLTLTYDKLQQVSQRLKLPMSELFAIPGEGRDAQITGRRSIGRTSDAVRVTTPNYDYYYLNTEL